METIVASDLPSDLAPDLPYAGIKVIDLSQGLAGPFCTMLLAQHGADVIKVEPETGDWSRHLGTRHAGRTALEIAGNRGKRSIALDLKQAAAVAVVKRMVAGADVFVEAFRPGVAERLGLGYAALSAINPGLLYLSVSGYGQSGPYAHRPATDTVVQAFSGIMDLNSDESGRPNKVNFLAPDTITALFAFQAVATALYGRRAGGRGRHLDVSLVQSTAAFLTHKIVEARLEGDTPRQLNAPAGVYRTRDGWIAITMNKETQFASLCRAIGRPDLMADPRFATFIARFDHRTALVPEIQKAVLAHTTAEWLPIFAAHDVMADRIHSPLDWLDDPHVRATRAFDVVEMPDLGAIPIPAIPGAARPAAAEGRAAWPAIGAHGAAILREHGYAQAEIDALGRSGAWFAPGAVSERVAGS